MRTTVDLPRDLHEQMRSIARDTSRTMSETITFLLRKVTEQHAEAHVSTSAVTGLPTLKLSRITTMDDIRSLEDDE